MGNDVANITKLAPVVSIVSPATPNYQNSDKVAAQPADNITNNEAITAISPDELTNAVKSGNALFQAEQRELQMNFDYDAKRVVVKIVDRSTGEIIRQLPTKDVLNFVKQMRENAGKNGTIITSQV